MIKNKLALIFSMVLLIICMFLYFPFPNTTMLGARMTFMSFPIQNQDGYVWLGIMGSILFIIAMVLLVVGLKKYHFRAILLVAIAYTFIPILLITAYQETLATGISAISYDGNGECSFESVESDVLSGECTLELHNKSNEAVSFELEFMDSLLLKEGEEMESFMNLGAPFNITVEAGQTETIHLKELLDLSNASSRINSGKSSVIHLKLTDGENERIL